jgi:hypothetical protein
MTTAPPQTSPAKPSTFPEGGARRPTLTPVDPAREDRAAANEVELHPVIDICFGQDCDIGQDEVVTQP